MMIGDGGVGLSVGPIARDGDSFTGYFWSKVTITIDPYTVDVNCGFTILPTPYLFTEAWTTRYGG